MDYVIYNKKKFIFLDDKPSDINNVSYTYEPMFSYKFNLEEGVKTAKKLGDAWELMTTSEAHSRIEKVPYNEAKLVTCDGDEYEVIECRESHNPESYAEDYFILYGDEGMVMIPEFECNLPSRMIGSDIQFFE